MDFKNVDLNDYCLNLDLHKSMFFIDMLKDTYEFTLKGDQVEIFKKLKNGISEPITRKELIYSIQVEMVEEYEYSTLMEEEEVISTFDNLFGSIDSIHKTIDNMVYLEKYLNKKEESTDEEEEDEEEEDEEVSYEGLKMESMRLLKKQMEGAHQGENKKQDKEEFNELGENKKLVLKNALEKECFSPITELFRPAWTP